MDTRNNDFDFDFTPIGQAIKKARTAKGMTREQLARILDYDPRHLQAIENEGQKPSLELFIQLVTMFGVSVDEYIFPDNEVKRSSVRRRLDAELDKLNDKELSIHSSLLLPPTQGIKLFKGHHPHPAGETSDRCPHSPAKRWTGHAPQMRSY